jgi:hypothetical protein
MVLLKLYQAMKLYQTMLMSKQPTTIPQINSVSQLAPKVWRKPPLKKSEEKGFNFVWLLLACSIANSDNIERFRNTTWQSKLCNSSLKRQCRCLNQIPGSLKIASTNHETFLSKPYILLLLHPASSLEAIFF